MKILYQGALALLLISSATAQKFSGHWDGTAKINDSLTVPVHLEIAETAGSINGAFVDGGQRTVSTQSQVNGDAITLKFAQYATTFQGTLQDGKLTGTYSRDSGTASYPIELKLHVAEAVPSGKIPQIGGVWTIPTESPKGEHAWRLIVHQHGAQAAATILRIDGDTGTLAGRYKDGKFVLSHFQDVRPALLEITPAADGSLSLVLYGPHVGAKQGQTSVALSALRPSKTKELPKPDDAGQFTSVKDPHVPFRFSFPDLNGKLVSNTDPQFKNKVVLVNITGSWCPNCHDEAPYLAEIYRKYHAQGLEIVALDFEEPEQKQTLARLHSFIKKYGIEYTYLLAGEPGEVHDKVPQAVNLNAWPTTFFVGRDGRVHAVETGFPSLGSAEYSDKARQSYVNNIEKLLAEHSRAGE